MLDPTVRRGWLTCEADNNTCWISQGSEQVGRKLRFTHLGRLLRSHARWSGSDLLLPKAYKYTPFPSCCTLSHHALELLDITAKAILSLAHKKKGIYTARKHH